MQIHENLPTQDKYKSKHERHQSGKGSNGFGVDDLVDQLYNYVPQLYRTLRRGSINVRYENGLTRPLTIDMQLDIAKYFRHGDVSRLTPNVDVRLIEMAPRKPRRRWRV